ncbi:unnamed protein product, partial [Brenthis ino]
MSRDSSSEREEEGHEHKIYIDKRILNQDGQSFNNANETAPKFDTVYEINGEIFRDENHNDNGLFFEFEVQLNNWNDTATAVEKMETDDIYLEMSIQENNEGIIINSCIFLTLNQWNTLIVDENYKFCFVCDDVVESLVHIKMVAHMENLQRCRPLKKFDLSITRLIGESYHCAVCNITFNKKNDSNHFDSESHKGKMDHARNRALELTHSDENENSENSNNEVHFDRSRINSFNSILEYKSCEEFDDYDFSNDVDVNNGNNDKSTSYASMAKKPNTTPKYINDIYLEMSIQENNEGIIINSCIFLTLNQWNTLIVDENYTFCFVCDDVVDSLVHIKMVAHMENLQRCRPLKKFDLSITRLIGESYHCAVCNVTFDKNNDNDHFDSESHKDKMDHAWNRALELTHSDENENNEYNNNEVHLYRNRTNSCNSILDYESSEGFYDYEFSSDVDLNNGSNDKSTSYASMAKKPNTTPKYITQVVGGKKYNILFDHWHMVIYPRSNQFYCMTCKIFGHISLRSTHCFEENHIENLNKCNFVEQYNQYLIRQMISDFKFYHCGLCNELILISHVEDHIDTVHDKKYENIDYSAVDKNNKIQHKVKERNINNDYSINRNNDVSINGNNDVSRNRNNDESNKFQKIDMMNHNKMVFFRETFEINNVSPGLYNDIILNQFSCKLRISFVAYNVVLKVGQGYYCGICNLSTNENVMKYHIVSLNHVGKLRNIPFEAYFGSNLIRLINNRPHCTICNTLFDEVSLTLPHVASELHLALLNQALKIPDIPTPVKPKDSINHEKQIDSNQLMNQPKMDTQDNNIKSNEHSESLDDSIQSIENYEHEFLYLNFKNKNSKVTFNSYHSLVAIGDGTRYCFVCSSQIVGCTKQHIESKAHTISMEKCKFLDKFDKHLLRQMFLLYHCCTCNVIFSKKYLNSHLTWPIQEAKTSKKMRKADFNSGIKLLHVQTQKEEIYLKMQESNIEIIGRIDIKPKSNNIEIKKENKIIILDSVVLKLSWDAWQGIVRKKNEIFCCLCDKDLKNFELNSHIYEEWHANALESTFDKQYFPNLIRKVNDTTLNCLICNLVIPNKKHIILEHINGKKHKINYDTIQDNSATVSSYSDCNDNVLYL